MSTPPGMFEAIYQSDAGIGGYAPTDMQDHAFAFDGSSSGKRDHIVFYRPGGGKCTVIRHNHEKETFEVIYNADQGGIGGFDLSFFFDRAFAFDFEHSGKNDYIFCYRPGSGCVYILKHDGNGGFTPVFYQQATDKACPGGGNGIGGCDLRLAWDRVICFDMNRTKGCDTLVIYRRLQGLFTVLKNENGNFSPVYKEYCFGIGGYQTDLEADFGMPIDWAHSGYLDHLIFLNTAYDKKPLAGVVTKQGDAFVGVWISDSICGGFHKTPVLLNNGSTFGFTYDFESSGKEDYFGMYWVGGGAMWLMTSPNGDGNFSMPYKQDTQGIGPCDLKGRTDDFLKNDRCISFDFDSSGCMDHIIVYRRSVGKLTILRQAGHVPPPLQPAQPVPANQENWGQQNWGGWSQ